MFILSLVMSPPVVAIICAPLLPIQLTTLDALNTSTHFRSSAVCSTRLVLPYLCANKYDPGSHKSIRADAYILAPFKCRHSSLACPFQVPHCSVPSGLGDERGDVGNGRFAAGLPTADRVRQHGALSEGHHS